MLPLPLVIDLDGTLLQTDSLHESALQMIRSGPARLLQMPAWILRGKAHLKHQVASLTRINAAALPYNEPLLAWLREQRAQGRRLVLCTAADRSVAESVATHLALFDEVIATDGERNLAGVNKAMALESRFGTGGFDYAGNSRADLPVWSKARQAVVVNAPGALLARVRREHVVAKEFPREAAGWRVWRQSLRLHQWLKNVLLFVPMLAAHQLENLDDWLLLTCAFVSFGFCASAVYVANDLLDLESDRIHPRKRNRPFAAGVLPVWKGVVASPVLAVLGMALAALVGKAFVAWLAVYLALTTLYSCVLKRMLLMDCFVLALLYTVRVLAGGSVVGLQISFWLLAFSVFLFLSLAFVKRYAEMELQRARGRSELHGRGYRTGDAGLVQNMGIAAGQASVLVLALYLNSDAVARLYRSPTVIWAAVPVMLFWIHWMWMQAHRGNMHDDPVVFAVRDRTSQVAGVLVGLILLAGALGWP